MILLPILAIPIPKYPQYWHERWFQKRVTGKLNPISFGGGESPPPPQTDIAHYAYFCLGNMFFYYLTFRQPMIKKKLNFLGGNPPFGPPKTLKNSKFSKVTPHDLL